MSKKMSSWHPRMPGQQQVDRPLLVCLPGSILANRIQAHPWSPLPPKSTHMLVHCYKWKGIETTGLSDPSAYSILPNIWGNMISLLCWRKAGHHKQSHKWAGILDGSSPLLHTGNKMRLHCPSLHHWYDPSQNSLGAQTFQDNSLGGKNFVMLFYSILTAFGKGQATTLSPQTRMQVLQTSNTNTIRKEVLKEIRCLHCQVQGSCEIPAGCRVVRYMIPFLSIV